MQADSSASSPRPPPASLGRFTWFDDVRGELFAERVDQAVVLSVVFDSAGAFGDSALLELSLMPMLHDASHPDRHRRAQSASIDGAQLTFSLSTTELQALSRRGGVIPFDLRVTMHITHWVGPNQLVELTGATQTEANNGTGHLLKRDMFS
jgi:hypothetical protein